MSARMQDGEETGETSRVLNNDSETSGNSVKLQQDLDRIKREIIKAKAQLGAQPCESEDALFYGTVAGKGEFNKLIKERNQCFLNFTLLESAIKAGQANDAVLKAFSLDQEGNMELLDDEKEHMRTLLEDQKELVEDVMRNHEDGVVQSLQLIEARAKLATVRSRYQELQESLGRVRKFKSKENYEEATMQLHNAYKHSEAQLNELRFMIQKLLISSPKLGLQFAEKEKNDRYRELLLNCGRRPEKLRANLIAQTGEQMDTAPAAAGDFN